MVSQVTFGNPRSGELAGSATAVQCPTIPGKLVRFKALSNNAGNVYIGFSSSLTVADGTTDTTSGWQLGPGEDSGWIPIDNLNRCWRICDNAGDDLVYMVME